MLTCRDNSNRKRKSSPFASLRVQILHMSYSLQIYACKKDSHLCKSFSFISSFLSRLCVAVSLSFARPFAPSKDVLRLSRVTRPYRKPRHMKKDTYICKCLFLYQQIVPPRILPDTFVLLPFKFMHVKRTHISASPFPLSAASYPPGPLPAKYFRRL